MKALTATLLCVLAVTAFAAPPHSLHDTFIPIVASQQDGPNPDGSYSYGYQTGNGIQAQEQGQLFNIAKDEDALRVQGSFSYTDNNGIPISLSYSADETGFHPQGEHLPIAPPIPSAIVRALEYNAQHPEEDNL
ncbi:PREDICTED: endocuticle structural glycoprotein SgAbd-8-like [Atta cephalotes]|uniref:Endocuticle structural glycoprotein SgAbd-1 n=2 Tax=Atta TaxID=12956 RepID=A0A158NJT4_ATTCE|nr:PREDICTED: endocuticle structural glycoprotein SgAbd-8-like [Atta cephalotes]XP_018049513.1 PREDICTED: endocuticle structural glycoprotein SgAbd-8-like [Atta colombica]KYM81954.1 Endocuticle structural glycoprotein SgAbd-1 [Atta colombica]